MRGKKRLRKKRCIGEFREMGFRVRFRFAEACPEAERNSLLDDFVLHAVKANRMMFAGAASSDRWEGFLVLDARRGSVTEKQRAEVEAWFRGKGQLEEVEVGPLIDAWYGE
jgi:hypothetical protein